MAPKKLLRGVSQHLEEGAAGGHQGSLRVEDVDPVGSRIKQRGKGVKERGLRRFGGVIFGRSHGASLRGFSLPETVAAVEAFVSDPGSQAGIHPS